MRKRLLLLSAICIFFISENYTQNIQGKDSLNNSNYIDRDTVLILDYFDTAKSHIYTEPDSALKYYTEALKISKEIKHLKFIAKSYYNIGVFHFLQSNYDEAITWYDKALNIYEILGDMEGIAGNLSNTGLAYFIQGNYTKALEYYNMAMETDRKADNMSGVASDLGNIGSVYSAQNNYDKALEYQQKALKIREETGDVFGIAKALGNIGNIYSAQENFEKALEYMQRSLEILRETDEKQAIANQLQNIGSIYSSKNDYTSALEYYHDALQIYDEIGDDYGITSNLFNIGLVYMSLEEYNEALYYFKRSLKLAEEIGYKDGIASNLVNIGSLLIEKEQYYKAVKYENKALKIAKEIGALQWERDAYDYLSKAYSGLKNYKKALDYTNLWIQINDSIFNTEKTKTIEEMFARYETEKKEQQIKLQQVELEKSKKQTELEKAEREKQRIQRNMFIVAFSFMFLLAVFVFMNYRQKKKANALLIKQKHIISKQNSELNHQNEEISAQRDEMESQRDKINKQHTQITDSIKYASRIQTAALPKTDLKIGNLEYFILFKPRDIVSGDFYWTRSYGKKQIIIAADCTGHGVPGAFVSMLGISFLNEIISGNENIKANEILDELREMIKSSLHQTGNYGDSQDGMDIAVCIIDEDNSELEFAGANNPAYIFRDDEMIELKPDRMPVSIFLRERPFISRSIRLQKNDMIYIFSDGYSDQFGGKNGEKYKYIRFKNILKEAKSKTLSEQKAFLLQNFEDWRGDYDQIDDVLVIGFRF